MSLVRNIEEAIEEAKNGNIMEAASKIKRYIGMRKKGGKELVSINAVNSQLLDQLLELAYENKNVEPLNQALQIIAMEEDSDISNRIYKQILGYQGTRIDDLSPEYIDEIIRSKIDIEKGINKEDIIGILKQVITKTEADYNLTDKEKEKYIKLVEDTIMPIVDQDINSETKKITDIRILEIVTKLGEHYIPDYKKAYEIMEKGKKLKQFEGTDIYKENNKKCDETELLSNFEAIRCDERNLKQIIEKYMETFLKETKPKNPDGTPKPEPIFPPNPPGPSPERELIDLDKKIEALLFLVEELKKDFPNAHINGIFVGRDAFAKHVLIPIENVPITVLENLSDATGALYMTQNSNIGEFLKIKSKSDAKKFDNVKTVNHPNKKEDFDSRYENYKNRMITRAREIIEAIRNNGTIDSEKKRKVYSENKIDLLKEFQIDEVIDSENEKDPLDELSTEELEELDQGLDSQIKENDEDITSLNTKLEEAKERERARREELKKAILEKRKIKEKQEEEISEKKSELSILEEKNKKNKNNKNIGSNN